MLELDFRAVVKLPMGQSGQRLLTAAISVDDWVGAENLAFCID